jgi:predicted aminopeptidase
MRRTRWALFLVVMISFGFSGCQTPYLLKSAFSQADLLMKRVPIEDALRDPSLNEDQKRKLGLALDARKFAETELGLKSTKNYTSFVQLDRKYVTYVVSAAERAQLKAFVWKYPFVGSLPYRGFFNEADANAEAARLDHDGLDSMVRGVSAYSTLGWFRDPVLSSMLAYEEHDLVNTIIHETVHATLYIKSEADFNERLATFIGNKGTEIFYLKREGAGSATLGRIRAENEDDKVFSAWLTGELEQLEKWYAERAGSVIAEDVRRARIDEIKARFGSSVKPKLKGGGYASFEKVVLNNARLLSYKLYFQDLSEFERVFDRKGRDFATFLTWCKSLEDSKDPQKDLTAAAL